MGTNSCSGRGCHGSIDPAAGQPVRRNEHTIWLTRDKHADAYRVLFNERSQSIAKNMNILKAHEDSRCLACHTNPLLADDEAVKSQIPESIQLLREERLAGVGCEACHGPAREWLALHTTERWQKFTSGQKAEHGMTATRDLAGRAQVCTGCHVGAGPDEKGGISVRDVDHDLIAAGHPRLNFEFAAFHANLAKHWIEKDAHPSPLGGEGAEVRGEARRGPAPSPPAPLPPRERDESDSSFEARAWVIGQAASAKASLELLEYRAKAQQKPWPEFAEYDCFACHHDLNQPSRRQQRGYEKRLPGALSWSKWYRAMLPYANERLANDKQVQNALEKIDEAMSRPYPQKPEVARHAHAAASQLGQWLQNYSEQNSGQPVRSVDDLRASLISLLATDPQKQRSWSWDKEAQLYLALAALNEERPDAGVQEILLKLRTRLECRSNSGRTSGFRFTYDATGPKAIISEKSEK